MAAHRRPARSRLGAVGVVLALLGTALGVGSAGAASTPAPAGRVLESTRHGRDALATLVRNGNLDRVAALNRWSVAHVRTELGRDETLEVAPSGRLAYRDVAPELTANAASGVSASTLAAPTAPFPYAQTFALHSRPGSSKVMYLDFVGFVGGGVTWTPFDLDGQAGFSNAEMDAIQEIWARVAESYSAFEVDVTTADPGLAGLTKDSASDPTYGVRLIIGDGDGGLATICTGSCIGIAWTSSFGDATSEDPGGIVRVPNFTTPNVRDLAVTAVHELGHTAGLSHVLTAQGTIWSAVMTPNLSDAPLAQFTETGPEDEYAVMAGTGLLPRADESSPRAEAAGSFHDAGVISSPTDEDAFTFTVPAGSGASTIAVTPSTHRSSLDLSATLTDSGAQVIATSDPPAARVDNDTVSGLGASIAATLAPGSYTIAVRGTGLAGAYSSYGSIGSYTVTATVTPPTPPPPPPPTGFRITTTALPAATLGHAYRAVIAESGGVAPLKWKKIGKLPTGLKLAAATGVISGTPKKSTGTFSFTVQVGYTTKTKGHPAVKHTATRVFSITVR